jgi:hypothetical protein
MDRTWLLLIYTVPAEPTRKRAYIWRELKKVGAVYLRDGVCALPEQPESVDAVRAIAAKVEEFEGHATVVEGARLDPTRTAWLVEQARAARAEEYEDIARQARRLLEHIARETEHRDFTFAELEELEADLTKLKRWAEQVRRRDYFGDAGEAELHALLDSCDHALGAFLEQTASLEIETTTT